MSKEEIALRKEGHGMKCFQHAKRNKEWKRFNRFSNMKAIGNRGNDRFSGRVLIKALLEWAHEYKGWIMEDSRSRSLLSCLRREEVIVWQWVWTLPWGKAFVQKREQK